MADLSEQLDPKLGLELRRGVVVIAALSQLATPQYGYSLRQALAAKGMPIEEGTLYPLLRRLESQGLLASEWRIEDGPPRRYYWLSPRGVDALKRLVEHEQAAGRRQPARDHHLLLVAAR